MSTRFVRNVLLAAGAALGFSAQAGKPVEYVYAPAAGVHEVKYFHGCYDHTDVERRPKVTVRMQGLNTGDVRLETRTVEEGQPSTEMVTFRLKDMDASITLQFRSNDGPHCQQGVQRIVFGDKVLHGRGELHALR